MVIPALGTSANPVIARTTDGLGTNERGYIEVDPATQMTSVPGVFAGGDIVTGSATVILAMGAGRRAAGGILRYLGIAADSVGSRLCSVSEEDWGSKPNPRNGGAMRHRRGLSARGVLDLARGLAGRGGPRDAGERRQLVDGRR